MCRDKCNECNECNPCDNGCQKVECGCKFEVDAACVRYTKDNLSCTGHPKGALLEDILESIDKKLCEEDEQLSNVVVVAGDNVTVDTEQLEDTTVYTINSTGGGSGCCEIIAGTWGEIKQIKDAENLQENRGYYITDRNIWVKAVSNKDLELGCKRHFRIVKDEYYTPHTDSVNNYLGIYGQTIAKGSVPNSDGSTVYFAIWGGRMWSRDESGSDNPGNSNETIQGGWTMVNPTNDLYYESKIFDIKYNFDDDVIWEQSDDRGNIISRQDSIISYIDITDWGNVKISNNQCHGIFNNSNSSTIRNNSNSGPIFNNSNNGSIVANSNIGSIFNNSNNGSITTNSNRGSIDNNSNNGSITTNSNRGSISNNSNIGIIFNNSNGGYINNNSNTSDIYNNSNTGEIYNNMSNVLLIINNSNKGFIKDNNNSGNINNNNNGGNINNNTNVGEISRNLNTVSIYDNSNDGVIKENSNLGIIYNNNNNGAIMLNSNNGSIRDNSNNGNIDNNSNSSTIRNNSNSGPISNNSNRGSIDNNSNTSGTTDIQYNTNNGYINRNAMNGSYKLEYNNNSGNIGVGTGTITRNADITDAIVNK